MSQKRNSEAAALIARMIEMAGPVFAFACEVVAVVPIDVPLVLSDGANHERGQQKRQIDDADFKQVARDRAALYFRSGA